MTTRMTGRLGALGLGLVFCLPAAAGPPAVDTELRVYDADQKLVFRAVPQSEHEVFGFRWQGRDWAVSLAPTAAPGWLAVELLGSTAHGLERVSSSESRPSDAGCSAGEQGSAVGLSVVLLDGCRGQLAPRVPVRLSPHVVQVVADSVGVDTATYAVTVSDAGRTLQTDLRPGTAFVWEDPDDLEQTVHVGLADGRRGRLVVALGTEDDGEQATVVLQQREAQATAVFDGREVVVAVTAHEPG